MTAHCKEYGFIFQSSEIYDGLAAVYDYGQLGVELKNNIKTYWWDAMVRLHDNIVGIDSAIFMHPKIWEAYHRSGPLREPGAFHRVGYRPSVLLRLLPDRKSTRLNSSHQI